MCIGTAIKNVGKWIGIWSVVFSATFGIITWIGGKAVANSEVKTLRSERTDIKDQLLQIKTDISGIQATTDATNIIVNKILDKMLK